MKRIYIILFFAVTTLSYAQPKKQIYLLRIYDLRGNTKAGYLQDLNDSSMVISKQPLQNSKTDTVSFSDLTSIKIRKKNAPGEGALIGTAVGIGLGALIGRASYTEPACVGFCVDLGPDFSSLGGAIIGALSGSLIGLAAGSATKEIKLKSNKNSYDQVAEELEKYVLPSDY